jgi:biotin synthase
MDHLFYHNLTQQALAQKPLSAETAKAILTSPDIDIFPLINAAYEVRRHFRENKVSIHIINNAANGLCREDCHYCAQAKSADADIVEYPIKSDAEFLAEAHNAYKRGAHRYCMVFAGRGPSALRTQKLASLIKMIKSKYPLEVCVSTGLIDDDKAAILKEAGLDRLNHNLNTSAEHYPKICTTHTYEDRVNTLNAAVKAGLDVCSGMIVGMGESAEDIIQCAEKLHEFKARSIPINFYMPIEGNELGQIKQLTPQYCLRILCLFRFINPDAEIRVAAGREFHLRDMEVLAFYAADSLFLDGYLNTKGSTRLKTLTMLNDAGFMIESDHDLEELIDQEKNFAQNTEMDNTSNALLMKQIDDLRPALISTKETP